MAKNRLRNVLVLPGNHDIAQRMQITRVALGKTQTALCRELGISVQTWNNYERGTRRIGLDEALDLCNKIHVTLEWIYRGDPRLIYSDLADKIKAAQARLNVEHRPNPGSVSRQRA